MDAKSSTTNSDYDSSSNVGSFAPPSQVGMIVPTVSEEEQQGVRTNGDHLASLPRSVRWRIQLGLLQDPSAEDTVANTIKNGDEKHICNLETVLAYNHDVIFKQAERFKGLVEKYIEETTEVDNEQPSLSPSSSSENNAAQPAESDPSTAAEIDPLTAMVMEKEAQEKRKSELYLKYRKERARRKRGLTTEDRVTENESDEVDRASLIIIEKDLKRLPHPLETKGPIIASSSPPTSTPELEARITSLREILYIYAQEHPAMGYRQGMHEIASYLLYVLELEYQDYPEHPLFNPILPICFVLLERTLEHLKTAYDASGGKSLQQMSIAILGKILQNNPSLYHHLTNNPNIPPPPIYCTRWVRLMFSREVVGYENVFKLWDVLFSYANVMQALEIMSASRILLIGDALLLPENNTLDLLMNVPPLMDISPLTETLEKLMNQRESDNPIQLQSLGSMINPTGSTQKYQQHNVESSGVENPLQNSHHFRQPAQQHQRQYPSSGGESKFSFQNMRQSLGQKSESLRKKIITTTVEWKEAASRRDGSIPFDPLSAVTATTHQNNQMYSSRSSCNEEQKQRLQRLQQQADFQRGYGNFTSLAADLSTSAASPAIPITPRQHQHEMWSNLLQQQIWTVQQFLLDLESKENKGSVPRSVWEALADMDRMQRELLNYSRSSIGGPSY